MTCWRCCRICAPSPASWPATAPWRTIWCRTRSCAPWRPLGCLVQFRPGTSLKAWLFTILRNLFYEQSRRRRREAAALSAHLPGEELVRPDQDDASHVRDLNRMLGGLPPLLREALVLVGAQELSYDEAAAICGVPVGTMKARVSRARVQLAQVIAQPR